MLSLSKGENMKQTISKFIEELSIQVNSENESLQKSCAENLRVIKELRYKKNLLFYSMCRKSGVENHAKLLVVNHINDSNQLWTNSLQHGLHQIDQGVMQHNEVCSGWKEQIEMKLQLKQDEFTMMPYHDVEAEISALELKIKEQRKETTEILEKMEINSSTLEFKTKQIIEDIERMEPYDREMRKVKAELRHTRSEIKRHHQLDVLHLDEQHIFNLEQEVSEIQEQINILEKH